MAESNPSDVGALVETLTAALMSQAEATARVTAKPKPHPLLIAISGTLVAMIIGALVTYGALQQRVVALEARTQSVEQITSLNAKMDIMTDQVRRLEQRLNDLMDGKRQGR